MDSLLSPTIGMQFTEDSSFDLKHERFLSESVVVNILTIEDDPRIARILVQALTEEGHHVIHVVDGEDGLGHILSGSYDLALLDLMIPSVDGLEVLRHVRKVRSPIPILVLSARDGMSDVVRALDLGADDYLTKPFQLQILLARVRSVARRGSVSEMPVLEASDITLDRSRREVYVGTHRVELTKREFSMLECLMRRLGRPVTREQLIEAGWGLASDVSANNLEVQVHSLRTKLLDPQRIRTIRGIGYQVD